MTFFAKLTVALRMKDCIFSIALRPGIVARSEVECVASNGSTRKVGFEPENLGSVIDDDSGLII